MTTHPATTVQALIAEHYDLPAPIAVSFLRAYTNDVYEVVTPGARYVLKLYGAAWRTHADLRYEVDLLHHLDRKGVPVALPVAGRDGDPVQSHLLGAVERHMMLFHWAPGTKPVAPFPSSLYEIEGRAVAAFHAASDDFVSSHPRRPIDIAYLIDEPLAQIVAHLPRAATPDAGTHVITSFASQLRTRLTALATAGLDSGPCHGDATMDNFHIEGDDRIIWYDFDSGGPGWRACDLQGWAAIAPDAAPLQEAFLRGYQQVRPLARRDIEAAPVLAAAFEIWGTAVDLDRRSIQQGDAAVASRLAAAGATLRRWAAVLGFETTATAR